MLTSLSVGGLQTSVWVSSSNITVYILAQSSNIYITVILRTQLQYDKSFHAKHENNYIKFTESSVTMLQYRDY